METTRTDIHCPSQIIPSDYEYVAVWTMNIQGFGDAQFMIQEREACKRHMDRTHGIYSAHEHGGACDVCGNSLAIYLVLFYHAKSNTYIRVGVNCSMKLEMSGDEARMNLFKKNLRDAREAQAGKRKALAILEDLGLGDAWDIYTAEPAKHADDCALKFDQEYSPVKCTCGIQDTRNCYEERTITDIVGKLVRYGSVSPKASGFVKSLLDRILQRPIIAAQRQAEKDLAGPVPVGRVELTGEVVGMKEVEGPSFSYHDSGVRTKLIIKLENGSKIFGARFANLDKGSKVRFIATVEASKDDAKFGFYKRPVLYQSPEQKKAIKHLSHAYNKMRDFQLNRMNDINEEEGINTACDVLYKLWMSVLAETGDPVGKANQ